MCSCQRLTGLRVCSASVEWHAVGNSSQPESTKGTAEEQGSTIGIRDNAEGVCKVRGTLTQIVLVCE